MSASRPTVVFVHGAWHRVHQYAPLTKPLESAGYTVVAPTLPSVDGTQPSFDEDVAVVRKAIQHILDDGHDVAVLMHSYGGIVGSEAVKGLSKADRGSNGVTRMIYLTAFALPEGVSLYQAIGERILPWYQATNNDTQYAVLESKDIFYNDVSDAVAEKQVQFLGHQAVGAFMSKVTYPAWKHIHSTYIICEDDHALVSSVQEHMAQQEGNRFTDVVRLPAGHSPFLSMPERTAEVIRKAIGVEI